MAQNPRLEELRKRLAREPDSPLFAQYAEELRRAGELPEAIRVCREGLEKRPGYATVRVTLGRALAEAGDFAAARQEFEAVLQTVPENVSARRGLEELGPVGSAISGAAAAPATVPAVTAAPSVPQPAVEADEPPAVPATVVAATEGAADPSPAGGEPRAATAGEDEEYELEALRPPPVQGPPQLTFRPLVDEEVTRAHGQDVPTVVPETRGAPSAEPPVPKAAPPPVAPARPVGDDLASPTLAELYLKQGSVDKAAQMYAELVARDPTNAQLSSRLSEVRARQAAEAQRERAAGAGRGPALKRAIARLETLRAAFGRRPDAAGGAHGAAS